MLDSSKGRLSILEKFARLNITHTVFEKIDLFLAIMTFLEDKDLFFCSKVCYFFQFSLQSDDAMYIRILKYRLEESNT